METIKSDIDQLDGKKNGFGSHNASGENARSSSATTAVMSAMSRLDNKKPPKKRGSFWGRLCASGKSD